MGITRKLMSVSTAGLVDFRSDKERTARHTSGTKRAAKATRDEARKQTKMLEEQLRLQRQAGQADTAVTPATASPSTQVGPPPGIYTDPEGGPLQRWWDGTQWTEHTQQPG